ncbi:MAG: mandelate racemase/muconate lactonizing enzyme family protein [Gaiellaceae bacterium]
MRATRVRAFRQRQPFRRGNYAMGHVGSPAFESLIVALDTDEGVTGWGEMAVISPAYADSFAAGAEAGVGELAPLLLGVDPTQPRAVLTLLDSAMRGQPYVKSALDMACWDVTARAAGRPLCETLGARHGDTVPLYNVVTISPVDDAVALARELLADGYRRLQVKVGTTPEDDAERLAAVREAVGGDVVLFADANGGFTTGGARRFLRATRELEYVLEQPCRTYPECASVRRHCDRPLVLDESIVTLDDLLLAHRDRVADGITVKLQRVGGITRAVLVRDVAVELGLEVTVEDAGGASLVTAAAVHVGLGTPERLRVHTCDFHTWVTVDHGTGLPPRACGRQAPPPGPGLGIDVSVEALGRPVLDVGHR